MGKEEDWKELEKWQKEQEYKMENKYGANLVEPKFQKVRKIQIAISKVMDKFVWGICYGILIFLILIAVYSTICAFISWHYMTMISVPEVIEKRYNIFVNNLSSELETGKEGKYELQLKEIPEIEFCAIKDNITITDDYNDNCHKYFFEKWQSNAKEYFTVNEFSKNGLLEYETSILIGNEADKIEAEKAIQEFKEYAGKWYSESWKIEIRSILQ